LAQLAKSPEKNTVAGEKGPGDIKRWSIVAIGGDGGGRTKEIVKNRVFKEGGCFYGEVRLEEKQQQDEQKIDAMKLGKKSRGRKKKATMNGAMAAGRTAKTSIDEGGSPLRWSVQKSPLGRGGKEKGKRVRERASRGGLPNRRGKDWRLRVGRGVWLGKRQNEKRKQ